MGLRLSYLGIEASDLDAWQRFGDLLGFQSLREGTTLRFRLDERAQRLVITQGASNDVAFVGWDVDGVAELDSLVANLRKDGFDVQEGTQNEAAFRAVERFVRFKDPAGVPMELAVGAKLAATPFQSQHVKHGFVTGQQGLGHIVVPIDDYKKGEAFCIKHLQCALTDHVFFTIPNGRINAAFMHMNSRHHSIAYIQAPFPLPTRIHHLMVECQRMEDMGCTYDRLRAAGMNFGMTLGQHTNDRVLSFYVQTPSGFLMEFGAGGITVDDATWTPVDWDTSSYWGHNVLMPPAPVPVVGHMRVR